MSTSTRSCHTGTDNAGASRVISVVFAQALALALALALELLTGQARDRTGTAQRGSISRVGRIWCRKMARGSERGKGAR